ncbi:PepSY domain-containing protein [Gottfriedia acidiceleris]|uniref:PepSY domain-containing protein n=1 Tax=Gottfriedia acidiceleris TaxID=371036 RepID=UPI000B42EC63|nr:PepSY domain-containing protein [Gottfriedia acidiceleris]
MKKIFSKLGFFILTFGVVISGCSNQTTQNLSKEEVVSKIEKDSNKLVTSIEKEKKSTYEVEVFEKNQKKTLIVDAKNAKVIKEVNDRDMLDDKALDLLYKDEFVITPKQAKEIALDQVNDGTITEIEKEKDDHQFHYSVELMKDHINYSMEIDAKSGKITSLEQEDIFLND